MFVQISEKDPVVIVFVNRDFFHFLSIDRCETFSCGLLTESIPAFIEYTIESAGGEEKKKGVRIQSVYEEYTILELFRPEKAPRTEVCQRPGKYELKELHVAESFHRWFFMPGFRVQEVL